MLYNSELITFENGLRLVLTKTPNMITARINLAVLVGSEDEPEATGKAHLIEHTLFKGTNEYSQEQLSIEFDKISAQTNAGTSSELTEYNAVYPKFNVERAIELFSEMYFNSSFDEKGLEKEKLIIIEEIKMHQDVPSDCAFDQLISKMYAGTSMGLEIAGELEKLLKLTRQELLDFKNAHYTANNTIISIIGDFEKEEIVEYVNKYFVCQFDKNCTKGVQKAWTPKVYNKPEITIKNKKLHQSNIMIGLYLMDYSSEDKYKFSCMNFILGGGMSSRLFVKLRNKLSLCYNIYSDAYFYKNNGFLLVDCSTTPQNRDKAISAIKEVLNDMAENGVSDEEFELSKNIITNSLLMKFDKPGVNMTYLAYNGELMDKEELINTIKSLKKEECEAVFKKYVNADNIHISIVE